MLSIVVFIPSRWDSPSFRHRQASTESLGKALGNEGVMLVAELSQSLLTFWYHEIKKKRNAGSYKNRFIQQKGPNLYIFSSFSWFPIWLTRLTWIRTLDFFLTKKQLSRVLRKLAPNSTRVSWFYRPELIDWAGQTGENILVYECYDKHDHNLKSLSLPGMQERLRHQEDQLLAKADVVFATSPLLYENLSRFHSNVYLFPNAVDVEFFSAAQRNDTTISEYVSRLEHPIIGYFGNLNRFFDVGVMLWLARKHPNWSFLIVGPENDSSFCNSKPYNDFKSLANVGHIPWLDKEIPNYFKAVDVCILPWNIEYKFVRFSSPNKLFQYAAMGKPVVSTDIPYCRGYPALAEIARTREEFSEKIKKALAEEGPEKIEERLRLAQENSWDTRSQVMVRVIRETILDKKANLRAE